MRRNELSDVSVFVEVARANGFRAAAERLKLGAGSVSEAVQRLEDRLGVRLFDRSTRKISLTALGQQLFEASRPAINDLESAIRALEDAKGTVSGVLRLNAPKSSGPFFLDKLICEYCAQYPDAKVELTYDDEMADLVTSGVDAVIRFEHMLEMDTHAVPIGPDLDMTIVGSPDYLTKRGTPKTAEELLDHDGLYFAIGTPDKPAPWILDNGQSTYNVTPKRRVVVNNLNTLLDYAQAGLGLAYMYSFAARPLLESGELVEVLHGAVPSRPRHTINYLTKRHMPE
ncbi:LysR substrate-binding domain-containing protein [Tateyamaria sp. SN3-11]|uniref:LysR substrate-binding domain-containing protein n=1 Tax=Tateyamaria sp. SN3-11 TaxID=3092147 RepID=UPI0039EAE32E